MRIANTLHITQQRECLGCGWKGWKFLPDWGANGILKDTLRPKCGAFSRYHLYFWWIINHYKTSNAISVLEIAPKPCSIRFFENNSHIYNYISVDLKSTLAMQLHDITNLGLKNDKFDLVLCSHVLEHVSEDLKGMEEIFRVVRLGGKAIIQVPVDWSLEYTVEYYKPRIYEDNHVRKYGKDFLDRLQKVGFKVEIFDITQYIESKTLVRYGIKPENLIICLKKQNAMEKLKGYEG